MNHACHNRIVVLAKCCLALALLVASSSAHATDSKLLCFNSGNAPDSLDAWRLVCQGEDIYADVVFTPTDETKGQVQIHVTSHGACDENHQQIICKLNNSNSQGCFDEETFPPLDYDGFASGAVIICGCYDEGVDPCS